MDARLLRMAQKTYTRTYIREWRQHRKMTLQRLAELSGMAESTLSLLENGQRGYSQPGLEKIAKALRVTVGELTNVDPTRDSALWRIIDEMTDPQKRQAANVLKALVRPG